jgi:predicted DNA-binding protein (MmcQ/YjbR family)
MKLGTLRKELMRRKAVTEEQPFGPAALVYKVAGKMFALLAWKEHPLRLSVSCDAEEAILLRERYGSITEGYHLNKRLWNTIVCDGEVPQDELFQMIEDSYDIIVAKFTKKLRAEYEAWPSSPP